MWIVFLERLGLLTVVVYCTVETQQPPPPLSMCETIDIIGFLSPRHQFLFWFELHLLITKHTATRQTVLLKLWKLNRENIFRNFFQNLFYNNMLMLLN